MMSEELGRQGLVHIYCGDGKGKSTAATGLAIRAAGSGMKVLFARFLKTERSAELKVLREVPEIDVKNPEKSYGFFAMLTDAEKAELREVYARFWKQIKKDAKAGAYQMLVLDEILVACSYGVIPLDDVDQFLRCKPEELEVVMTGRNPDERLLARADYVSEIQKVKHPYDRGVTARKGIEF